MRRRFVVAGPVGVTTPLALTGPAAAEEVELTAETVQARQEDMFVLLAAVLVSFMQAGSVDTLEVPVFPVPTGSRRHRCHNRVRRHGRTL